MGQLVPAEEQSKLVFGHASVGRLPVPYKNLCFLPAYRRDRGRRPREADMESIPMYGFEAAQELILLRDRNLPK